MAELASRLIAVFEGERLKAYQDTGGIWTNGIGNTIDVIPGSIITHEQSLADFARNQRVLLAMVTDKPVIEGACLVSFGFNCGRGALRKVLTGSDTIGNPVHTTDRTGKAIAGLVARRALEECLIQVSNV